MRPASFARSGLLVAAALVFAAPRPLTAQERTGVVRVQVTPDRDDWTYKILAEPKGEGKFPAVMSPPGAGVRPYRGLIDLAEKGVITLQVGIHGLPVNLDPVVYESLARAGLSDGPVACHMSSSDI